ncbi:MAG: RluA family pseudouridine synthase [Thermaurantimonas sp.]|nr:RluA family pseudouridine synthase [Thermaurantimonas aggregans]MCX8148959.1 RluA family pseudouridine synthase [Thermaurantimonas aggregans]
MKDIDLQDIANRIVYEDNHLLIFDKRAGELVQGDKTGDTPLLEILKNYIKITRQKPGNVFLGVTHRLDRPTLGLVIFAKTSKALERINALLRTGSISKTYRAIVEGQLAFGERKILENNLIKNPKNNKTYVVAPDTPQSKLAKLEYQCIQNFDHYSLLEVRLYTGRHHQIRCQLAHLGHCIKGDVKYGAKRANPDGSISLQAYQLEFIHPVSKQPICVKSTQSLHLASKKS